MYDTPVQFGVLLQHLQVLRVHARTVIWYSKEGYEHKMKVGD